MIKSPTCTCNVMLDAHDVLLKILARIIFLSKQYVGSYKLTFLHLLHDTGETSKSFIAIIKNKHCIQHMYANKWLKNLVAI